jgi:hypothetical protein
MGMCGATLNGRDPLTSSESIIFSEEMAIKRLDTLKIENSSLYDQVISQQFDPDHMAAMTEQFKPLQIHIDQARGAVLKNEHTKTLEEINPADCELPKITQDLPPREED